METLKKKLWTQRPEEDIVLWWICKNNYKPTFQQSKLWLYIDHLTQIKQRMWRCIYHHPSLLPSIHHPESNIPTEHRFQDLSPCQWQAGWVMLIREKENDEWVFALFRLFPTPVCMNQWLGSYFPVVIIMKTDNTTWLLFKCTLLMELKRLSTLYCHCYDSQWWWYNSPKW